MTVIEYTQAKKGNLLIIGDLLIDKTWFVEASKLSPEAPVPVVQLTSSGAIEDPGGAGLAASFGTKIFTDLNIDFYTATTKEKIIWLNKKGIKTKGTLIDSDKVIYKTRFIDKNSRYHLIRVDNDNIAKESRLNRDEFTYELRKYIRKGLNGIVLLDYKKGIFNDKLLLSYIIEESKRHNIPTYVDSRSNDLNKFNGIDYLKLNKNEFADACFNLNCLNEKQLIEKLNIKELLITKGEDGADLHNLHDVFSYKATLDEFPGAPDVTGCGDAFDISFCYYKMVKRLSSHEAFKYAVDTATEYAHMPIEERLC